ncbi:cation:proton antiporter [Paraburkholderia sp. A1RI-2L]|uniref:cation:proton antiporter domain-containing protein n=1 Tax=Paraburkholderia sp. A1RI-2L TaxID=3028367 RepID=UPI003B781611
MTYHAILIASILLLFAFGIERVGKCLGIPSVVALIVIGMLCKSLPSVFAVESVDISSAIPVLGTLGLVLIVLEGALDIKLSRQKLRPAMTAFAMAGIGFSLCFAVFSLVAHFLFSLPPREAMIVAVPFSVISSAVAIPGSGFLSTAGREFVVYESAISDILGVLVFYTLLNSDGAAADIMQGLVVGGLLSLTLGAACAIALLWVLLRVDGHIRFIPLLAGLFALYITGKLMHLSPLIMVLLFGLFLNNRNLLARVRWLSQPFAQDNEGDVEGFKALVQELTFAVRSFFFILLGYWTNASALASPTAWAVATMILVAIFWSRNVLLRLARISPAWALTWIAPRGLITVLLFLSAKKVAALPSFLDGATLIVVFASAMAMSIGRRKRIRRATA